MDKGAEYYARYLNGDDEGLVLIVRDYKDGLILYLNGICRDIHTAEDLCEDTFFRLFTKRPRFSEERSSFKTWLYSIAHNIALDYLKSLKNGRLSAGTDCGGIGYVEEDVESAYIKEENALRLHGIIKTLPDDYRQVLYLTYFENFDNASAAKIMKKNKRQIENLVYRAKKALKARLLEEGFEYENE